MDVNKLILRDLQRAIRNLIAEAGSPPKVVQDADDIVELILEILGQGLYEGLSMWSVLRLLERLDIANTSSPVARRLRFASKTVNVISSIAAASDMAKARAFVRCALNTGCLTSSLELLSVLGTSDRVCRAEHGDGVLHVSDLWSFVLNGQSQSDGPPTVERLLQPFIAEGANVLRASSSSGEKANLFHQFIASIAAVGGAPLSAMIEAPHEQPPASVVSFNLKLHDPLVDNRPLTPPDRFASCDPLSVSASSPRDRIKKVSEENVNESPTLADEHEEVAPDFQTETETSVKVTKRITKRIVKKKKLIVKGDVAMPSAEPSGDSPVEVGQTHLDDDAREFIDSFPIPQPDPTPRLPNPSLGSAFEALEAALANASKQLARAAPAYSHPPLASMTAAPGFNAGFIPRFCDEIAAAASSCHTSSKNTYNDRVATLEQWRHVS